MCNTTLNLFVFEEYLCTGQCRVGAPERENPVALGHLLTDKRRDFNKWIVAINYLCISRLTRQVESMSMRELTAAALFGRSGLALASRAKSLSAVSR